MTQLTFTSHPFLAAYVTCGDPNLAASKDIILSAIAAGADVVELGVPFSDPVADGPVIQRASERALANRKSEKQKAVRGWLFFPTTILCCVTVWTVFVMMPAPQAWMAP